MKRGSHEKNDTSASVITEKIFVSVRYRFILIITAVTTVSRYLYCLPLIEIFMRATTSRCYRYRYTINVVTTNVITVTISFSCCFE